MLLEDIERTETLINGALKMRVLTSDTIRKIFQLACKQQLPELKELLEGSTTQLSVKDFSQLTNVKKGLIESQVKIAHNQNSSLSREEFQVFLDMLLNEMRQEGIEIPDYWGKTKYWKKLITNATAKTRGRKSSF